MLHHSTKIQVYRAVIIPTLLYGAETWVLYWKHIKLLEQFYKCCLRSNLGIKWQDHESNEEVLTRTCMPSIESILLQVQVQWAGHITRMERVPMPKAVFISELQEGKRDRGASRKCYKDQLKSAEETAYRWKSAISHGRRRPKLDPESLFIH